jgi:glycosyltransferase involved in cell wall biosynthesis
MKKSDFVNICIVTHNRLAYTRQAIDSICEHTIYPHVITVIDNNSTDGTPAFLKKLHARGIIKNLRLRSKNIGVARASNQAWRCEPEAAYYLKYDNDIVIQKKGWLRKMVRVVEAIPFAGVVGYNFETQSFPAQTINGISVRLKYRNIGGACILIPKRTEALLGHWCEDYGIYGEEDGDYGIRTELVGLSNIYMKDEHIGIHLPAGRGAAIDARTFIARDGVEEKIDPDYRRFKDRRRRFNQCRRGAFPRNLQAYRTFQKPFYYFPSHVYKKSVKPICSPSHLVLKKTAFSYLEKMLRLKQKAGLKTLGRDYYMYGKLLVKNGDLSAGKKYFRKALSFSVPLPIKEKATILIADIEDFFGHHRSAARYYERSLRCILFKKNKTVYDMYRIASLYKKKKDCSKAEQWFMKVCASKTERTLKGYAYFHIGEIFLVRGDLKEAVRALKRCCALCPEHKKAKSLLAEISKDNKPIRGNKGVKKDPL